MGLNLESLFKRRQGPLLGVDFGASSIKVVELAAGKGGAMRLEHYAVEPLERGAIVDGNIERADVVADTLIRALRKAGTSTKNVALALPSASVITKRIALPAGMSEDDYEYQVESEASQYIPFAIDEVNLDFQILGPMPKDPNEVEVLLAASRKDKVEDRLAVAEMAGLNPVIMDVEPFAARGTLDHIIANMPNHGDGVITAVFDIGQNSTRLAVVLAGETVFERDHSFGGALLTQEIIRLYGLTPEEAEEKKISADLPDNYQVELLEPYAEQGASDLARMLQFFYTSTPYTRIDRIFLAGGVASTPGLREKLHERTSIQVDLVSPFEFMEIGPKVREKQLLKDAPALLVGCGLAMRRFDA